MKWFKEITAWEGNTPNHTYLLSDNKSEMYAYVMDGTNTVKKFVEPYRFYIARRKFKEVPNKWNFSLTAPKVSGQTWRVAGSKGAEYTVAETAGNWTCTCAGFMYRGKCKHIEEQKAK